MKRFASFLLFITLVVISVMASEVYTVSSSSQLNVRNQPAQGGSVIGKMPPGTNVNVESIESGWAKIEYNGQAGYVSSKYLTPVNLSSTVPSGARPGPGQHIETTAADDMVRYFSTNRIMEKLPDFGYLRGKAGNPDVWFWMAFSLLAICTGLKYYDKLNSDWCFYTVLAAFIGAGICEVIYLLSSEEPLSFFSPDINSLFKAIASFIILLLVLMEQLSTFASLLVRIQKDADRGFMASYISYFVWAGVIGLLGYFFTLIIEDTPYTWWWPVFGVIVCIPIIAMIISSFSNGGWKSAVLGIPLYIIGSIPLLLCLTIVSIAIIFLLFTVLMISLLGSMIGHDGPELRYDKRWGYYYVFPDGTIKGNLLY